MRGSPEERQAGPGGEQRSGMGGVSGDWATRLQVVVWREAVWGLEMGVTMTGS